MRVKELIEFLMKLDSNLIVEIGDSVYESEVLEERNIELQYNRVILK